MINLINLEASGLVDEDLDYMLYINAAMDLLNFNLLANNIVEFMDTVTITDGYPVPSNFVTFIPKTGIPCRKFGKVFKTYHSSVTADYACSVPHVSVVTDTIPFDDLYITTLVFIASFLIKKKSYIPTEYTQADYAYVASLVQPILKAKGVG
jgi:hypothetical protein